MVKSCTIWNDNQYTDNYRLGFDFEDDKKPDKIVLSNRDDDRGYNNPVRWEFEIVDKKYIDDADANLQRQITDNANHIADHETRITHNEHELADHETRIANNTMNITANAGQIAIISGDVANLETRVTGNTNNISSNDARITALEQRPQGDPYFVDRTYAVEVDTDWAFMHSYISYLYGNKCKICIEVDYQTEHDINFDVPFSAISPFDWWEGQSGGVAPAFATRTDAYMGKHPDYTHFVKNVTGWVNVEAPDGTPTPYPHNMYGFVHVLDNDVNVTPTTYTHMQGSTVLATEKGFNIQTMRNGKQTGRLMITLDFDLVNV